VISSWKRRLVSSVLNYRRVGRQPQQAACGGVHVLDLPAPIGLHHEIGGVVEDVRDLAQRALRGLALGDVDADGEYALGVAVGGGVRDQLVLDEPQLPGDLRFELEALRHALEGGVERGGHGGRVRPAQQFLARSAHDLAARQAKALALAQVHELVAPLRIQVGNAQRQVVGDLAHETLAVGQALLQRLALGDVAPHRMQQAFAIGPQADLVGPGQPFLGAVRSEHAVFAKTGFPGAHDLRDALTHGFAVRRGHIVVQAGAHHGFATEQEDARVGRVQVDQRAICAGQRDQLGLLLDQSPVLGLAHGQGLLVAALPRQQLHDLHPAEQHEHHQRGHRPDGQVPAPGAAMGNRLVQPVAFGADGIQHPVDVAACLLHVPGSGIGAHHAQGLFVQARVLQPQGFLQFRQLELDGLACQRGPRGHPGIRQRNRVQPLELLGDAGHGLVVGGQVARLLGEQVAALPGLRVAERHQDGLQHAQAARQVGLQCGAPAVLVGLLREKDRAHHQRKQCKEQRRPREVEAAGGGGWHVRLEHQFHGLRSLHPVLALLAMHTQALR
jgi:hypothetical protein